MRKRVLFGCAATVALGLGLGSATVGPATAGTFDGRNGAIAFASAGDHGVEIYVVCPDGSSLTRLVKTPNDRVSAYSDWSPDGRTLAFDSDRSGNVELYVQSSNGHLHRLTHNPAGDSHPTWSPNGRTLAFESNRSGVKQIWTVSPSGGPARQVTDFAPGAEEPAYSPTGQWIVFLSGPEQQTALFIVRPDGTGLHQLTRRALNAGHPSWSPDGTTIVFNSNIEQPNGRLWTVDLHGHARQLTHGPTGQEDFEPAYSPDGKYVAYARYTDDPASTDIWVIRTDGNGAHDITPTSDRFDLAPTWSVATPSRCR
jgi:Tol biopolymer transport system component